MAKPKKKQVKNNYSFLLSCLCGVTAAALITAGIIITTAAKTAAIGVAATAAIFAVSPVLPLLGFLLLLAGLCLLPLLFYDFGRHHHGHHHPGIFRPRPRIVLPVPVCQDDIVVPGFGGFDYRGHHHHHRLFPDGNGGSHGVGNQHGHGR